MQELLPVPAPAFDLRPYQEDCIQAVLAGRDRGVQRMLVVMGTGAGKTVVFSHLTHRMRLRTVVIVHREELAQQAVGKLRAVLGRSATVGIVKAAQNDVHCDVLVCSIQTIARANRQRQLPRDVGLIIADETHHARSSTWMSTLRALGCWRPGGPLLVGVTATPDRADGKAIGDLIFQEQVFERSMLDLIQDGYLCDVRAMEIRLAANLNSVHTSGGDFQAGELADVLNDANAPGVILQAYQEHAGNRKALAFTPTVAMAYDLASRFRAAGIAAEAIDGTTHPELRRATLRRLASGETRMVANCSVLTEGFDEPSVDCLLLCRPTKSRSLFVQMLGRGMRTHPGKQDCLILDLCGQAGRHDVCNVPVVFGLDDNDDLPSVKSAVKQQEVLDEARAIVAEENRQQRLIDEETAQLLSQEIDLFRVRSRLNWLPVDEIGTLALNLGNGILKVGQLRGGWAIVLERKQQKRQLLATGLSAEAAILEAEKVARTEAERWALRRDAGWRTRPVTEKTINFARQVGLSLDPGITAGEASDRIAIQQARRNVGKRVAR